MKKHILHVPKTAHRNTKLQGEVWVPALPLTSRETRSRSHPVLWCMSHSNGCVLSQNYIPEGTVRFEVGRTLQSRTVTTCGQPTGHPWLSASQGHGRLSHSPSEQPTWDTTLQPEHQDDWLSRTLSAGNNFRKRSSIRGPDLLPQLQKGLPGQCGASRPQKYCQIHIATTGRWFLRTLLLRCHPS